MHVNFGQAWDATPGVFGTDMAEEYEMAENIGFLGAYEQDFAKGGKHKLTARTYFQDTSGLAESAITRCKKTREVIGGSYENKINKDIMVTPLLEYVSFNDADGTDGQDRSYLTAALGVGYGNWNAAVSGTFKETETAAGVKTNEEQLQLSAEYLFPIGIGVDVAYKWLRNAGVDTDVFGTLLTYGLDF